MPPAANFRSSQDSRKKPRAAPNTFGRINTTSGMAVGSNSTIHPPACDLEEVGAVAGLRQRQRQLLEASGIDVAGSEGNLLRATYYQALPALECLDEHRSLQQCFVCFGFFFGGFLVVLFVVFCSVVVVCLFV